MQLRLLAPVLQLLPLLLLIHAAAVLGIATVEHSFDGLTFHKVGDITLEDDDTGGSIGTYDRHPITDHQLQQLKSLVETDELYLWRVRLPGQPAVLTSIKATCLAEYLLNHELSLAITESGQLVSTQISIPQTADAGCSAAKALQQLQQLPREVLLQPQQQRVAVSAPGAAPAVPTGPTGAEAPDITTAGGVPNLAAAGQASRAAGAGQPQPGAAGQQGEGGEAAQGSGGEKAAPPPDTRTWWQKNWLYVMAGGTMIVNLALKATMGDVQPGGQPGAPAQQRPARRQ